MSRSRKKLSIWKDKNCKKSKRWANKKVRQLSIDVYLPNGNKWKRLLNSWDICDWINIIFKSEIEDELDEQSYQKGFRK